VPPTLHAMSLAPRKLVVQGVSKKAVKKAKKKEPKKKPKPKKKVRIVVLQDSSNHPNRGLNGRGLLSRPPPQPATPHHQPTHPPTHPPPPTFRTDSVAVCCRDCASALPPVRTRCWLPELGSLCAPSAPATTKLHR